MHRCQQVHAHHPVDLVEGAIEEPPDIGDAGVVDQQVDGAVGLDRVEQFGDGVEVGQVGRVGVVSSSAVTASRSSDGRATSARSAPRACRRRARAAPMPRDAPVSSTRAPRTCMATTLVGSAAVKRIADGCDDPSGRAGGACRIDGHRERPVLGVEPGLLGGHVVHGDRALLDQPGGRVDVR